MNIVNTYRVVGMTCDHCTRSVAEELSQLDGVTDVDVDLATGIATVSSTSALDESDVAAAIDEAGYELTS